MFFVACLICEGAVLHKIKAIQAILFCAQWRQHWAQKLAVATCFGKEHGTQMLYLQKTFQLQAFCAWWGCNPAQNLWFEGATRHNTFGLQVLLGTKHVVRRCYSAQNCWFEGATRHKIVGSKVLVGAKPSRAKTSSRGPQIELEGGIVRSSTKWNPTSGNL